MDWRIVRCPQLCGPPNENNTKQDVLWDYDRLLEFEVPACFQLTAVPASLFIFLSLSLILNFIFSLPLTKKKQLTRQPSTTVYVVGWILLAISTLDFVVSIATDPPYCFYVDAGMRSLTFLTLVLSFHLGHQGSHVTFWTLNLTLNLAKARSMVIQQQTTQVFFWDQGRFSTFLVLYALSIIAFVNEALTKTPDDVTKTPSGEKSQKPKKAPILDECLEVDSGFLSRLTFSWMLPLLFKGRTKRLMVEDLPDQPPDGRAGDLVTKFNSIWSGDVQHRKLSLIYAVMYTSWRHLTAAVLSKLLACCWEFTTPLLARELLAWMSSDDQHLWKGFFLSLALVVCSFLNTAFDTLFNKYKDVMYDRTWTSISAALYRKALRLSSHSRRNMSIGEIVNIMSVDVGRICQLVHFIHDLWLAPLIFCLNLYFMWHLVGPSCLAGLGLLLVLAPINGGLLSKMVTKYEKEQIATKDLRIKKTSQLLSGMKVLKMYAWEGRFAEMIEDVRREELSAMTKEKIGGSGLGLFWHIMPFLVPICIFVSYVMSDASHVVTPEIALLTLHYSGSLNWSFSVLPMIIPFITRSFSAQKRVSEMLLKPELNPDAVDTLLPNGHAVKMQNGTFTWHRTQDEGTGPVLKDISMEVERGHLVAVVGRVGSGKSSLLSALLGELTKLGGRVALQGSVAYVPQQAWIQNLSLQKNILFSKDLIEERYRKVIKACALETDLQIFPQGDQTEIGEKGVNLSGGQKQRVSLARALYRNADVYLFDDPLSAVDAHVGKHIFDKVLGPQGLLCKKTRILVTNGVSFLPQCDCILVMRDGELTEVGTYNQLLKQNGQFAEYLQLYGNQGNEENKTQDPVKRPVLKKQLSCSLSRQLSRQISTLSDSGESTDGFMAENENETTVDEEDDAQDLKGATFRHFMTYIKAASLHAWVALFVTQSLMVGCDVMSNSWLQGWTDDPVINGTQANSRYRMTVYATLGVLKTALLLGSSGAVCFVGVQASYVIHRRLLLSLIRAPMSFFDTTQLGRILSRFSTDMERVDKHIPGFLSWSVGHSFSTLATLISLIYSSPMFIVLLLPVFTLFYFIQKFFHPSTYRLSELQSSSWSPIYAHFDETLNGAACLRAFKAEKEFIHKNDQLINRLIRAMFYSDSSRHWYRIFMEFSKCFVLLVTLVYAIMIRDYVTSGLLALLMRNVMDAMGKIRGMSAITSDLEPKLAALARIRNYTELTPEAPTEVRESNPGSEWPEHGHIHFNNYTTSYSKDQPPVINNLQVKINGGEKIGIVGRTGAGKSSILMGLFRIVEADSGAILVDNVDISKIGLHDLRSQIMTIPQDPVLFSGTLRSNLDPFNVFSQEEVWRALELAHLRHFVSGLPEGVNHEVGEGGESLSVGQRQLVCLARAVLRKSQILVLDEATAAVDLKTDDLIQGTIRSTFSQCTVLTIAHRLNTILDYDRILVLDKGRKVEFDTPEILLKNKDSIFHLMARDTGII